MHTDGQTEVSPETAASGDGVEPAPSTGKAAAPRTSLTRAEKFVGAASLVGAALLMFLVMTWAGASATPVEEPPPVRTAAPSAAGLPAPAWTNANSEYWTGSARGLAYEVDAETTVSVWMRAVRPSLVVRCVDKLLDVFVFVDSAAQIERGTPDHTVRFQFDDGPEESALWPDADAHDALFPPDSAAFVRRLALARTLRFGFTPHNAAPVTARFRVDGIESVLVSAAKAGCTATGR